MKYIKKLNIDFNDWEEIDNHEIIINKKINDVDKSILNVNDIIIANFRIENFNYTNEIGIIKFINNNKLCIDFKDSKQFHGHKGGGLGYNCWNFNPNLYNWNLYIQKIIKNN